VGYLGYRGGDADTPFGRFFEPHMAPLPRHVTEALEVGPLAAPLLLRLADAPRLLEDGYHETETGYGHVDGAVQVSVLTRMPGVTPAMWDWWFGWHGCDARRYKLWHPRAHVDVRWQDGDSRQEYVGRTSLVSEYIGAQRMRAAISFVEPDLGPLGEDVAVCARLSAPGLPFDVGRLIHHVRAVPAGSEMRSRFWLGGAAAPLLVRPFARLRLPDPRDLLVHCAQEMNHLAARLAELYELLGAV
jgi:hypothetical protein